MKEYTVSLERTVTEEGWVLVEAESEAEAFRKAEALPSHEIEWDAVEWDRHFATLAEEEELGDFTSAKIVELQDPMSILNVGNTVAEKLLGKQHDEQETE